MMHRPLLALLLAGALSAAGCTAPVPLARNYPLSTQYKVRAAHHWDVIAADAANQTVLSLDTRRWLADKPLYVENPHPDVPFQQSFHNFMITHLVNRGLNVSDSPFGTLHVSYETQIVRHGSPRPRYSPGALTALAGGIIVARNLALGTPSPWVAGAALLGTAATADIAAGQAASPTQTELVLTTSITDNGLFIMRKSDVYYVDELDMNLFVPPPPSPPQPAPIPSVNLEVVDK